MKRTGTLGDEASVEKVAALDTAKAAEAAMLREAELSELRGLLAETQRLLKSTQDPFSRISAGGHGPCEDQRKDLLLKITRVEAALARALPVLEQVGRDPAPALAALDDAISGMLDAEEALHRCKQGAWPDTPP